MARYDNTFEGGSNGTAITVANSGGASGNPFDVIVENGVGVTSSTNIVYSSAAAVSGALGCLITLGSSANYLRLDADTTMEDRIAARLKIKSFPGPATTGINTLAVVMATSTRVLSLVVGTDGKPFFTLTNSGTYFVAPKPTTAPTTGSTYTFEIVMGKASVAGATDGELGLRILDSSGATFHTWTGTGNTGVDAYTAVRFGGASTSGGWTSVGIDSVSFMDLASGWPTEISSGSTTVTIANRYAVDFRASTSGGGNTLSYSMSWTSGPNNLSTVTQPVSGLFLVTQDASDSSVYSVAINDGGTITNQSVTVPALSGSGTTTSGITEYIWDGSSWS